MEQLSQQWTAELKALSESNAEELVKAATSSRAILPLLNDAIGQVDSLSAVYGEYCAKLAEMKREIEVVQEINHGLGIQSANQRKLFQVLQTLLSKIDAPALQVDIEKMPFDQPKRVSDIVRTCTEISQHTANTEDGLMIRAVQEYYDLACKKRDRLADLIANYVCRVIAKFTGSKHYLGIGLAEEAVVFLRAYEPLIRVLGEMDPKKHQSVLAVRMHPERRHSRYK